MLSIDCKISDTSFPAAFALPIDFERRFRSFCRASVAVCRVLRWLSNSAKRSTSRSNFFFFSASAIVCGLLRIVLGSNISLFLEGAIQSMARVTCIPIKVANKQSATLLTI